LLGNASLLLRRQRANAAFLDVEESLDGLAHRGRRIRAFGVDAAGVALAHQNGIDCIDHLLDQRGCRLGCLIADLREVVPRVSEQPPVLDTPEIIPGKNIVNTVFCFRVKKI
jgi:hypothetical protein